MRRFWISLVLVCAASTADTVFDLAGRLHPEERASVTIFGNAFPFTASTLSEKDGRFQFKKLQPGPYTVSILTQDRGEARKTIEIGPGAADARGRIALDITFTDSDFELADTLRRRHSISAAELAIPAKAQRDYEDAHRDLNRHDPDGATRRLEEAVGLAPQFADAWNELGTIAYQTQHYDRAEEYFRSALEHDPRAYEPLVNLGGVLVTVNRPQEAWKYNVMAVAARPNDALAHSQLGMNCFELGDLAAGAKELERARAIDPAHFSHPQLFLAEIYLRQGDKKAAANVLEEFLHYHPDWPQGAILRAKITELRK